MNTFPPSSSPNSSLLPNSRSNLFSSFVEHSSAWFESMFQSVRFPFHFPSSASLTIETPTTTTTLTPTSSSSSSWASPSFMLHNKDEENEEDPSRIDGVSSLPDLRSTLLPFPYNGPSTTPSPRPVHHTTGWNKYENANENMETSTVTTPPSPCSHLPTEETVVVSPSTPPSLASSSSSSSSASFMTSPRVPSTSINALDDPGDPNTPTPRRFVRSILHRTTTPPRTTPIDQTPSSSPSSSSSSSSYATPTPAPPRSLQHPPHDLHTKEELDEENPALDPSSHGLDEGSWTVLPSSSTPAEGVQGEDEEEEHRQRRSERRRPLRRQQQRRQGGGGGGSRGRPRESPRHRHPSPPSSSPASRSWVRRWRPLDNDPPRVLRPTRHRRGSGGTPRVDDPDPTFFLIRFDDRHETSSSSSSSSSLSSSGSSSSDWGMELLQDLDPPSHLPRRPFPLSSSLVMSPSPWLRYPSSSEDGTEGSTSSSSSSSSSFSFFSSHRPRRSPPPPPVPSPPPPPPPSSSSSSTSSFAFAFSLPFPFPFPPHEFLSSLHFSDQFTQSVLDDYPSHSVPVEVDEDDDDEDEEGLVEGSDTDDEEEIRRDDPVELEEDEEEGLSEDEDDFLLSPFSPGYVPSPVYDPRVHRRVYNDDSVDPMFYRPSTRPSSSRDLGFPFHSSLSSMTSSPTSPLTPLSFRPHLWAHYVPDHQWDQLSYEDLLTLDTSSSSSPPTSMGRSKKRKSIVLTSYPFVEERKKKKKLRRLTPHPLPSKKKTPPSFLLHHEGSVSHPQALETSETTTSRFKWTWNFVWQRRPLLSSSTSSSSPSVRLQGPPLSQPTSPSSSSSSSSSTPLEFQALQGEEDVENHDDVEVEEDEEDDDNEGQSCTICLEEYQALDPVARFPICAHLFHTECLTPWILEKDTCPICRTEAP
ncbi:hypothetical protein HMI54_010849 [Coelomomyces lativittatus]|nr:hypothetical protein HMI54_010849 [Coelomomyces lativittatus]